MCYRGAAKTMVLGCLVSGHRLVTMVEFQLRSGGVRWSRHIRRTIGLISECPSLTWETANSDTSSLPLDIILDHSTKLHLRSMKETSLMHRVDRLWYPDCEDALCTFVSENLFQSNICDVYTSDSSHGAELSAFQYFDNELCVIVAQQCDLLPQVTIPNNRTN